MGGEQTQCIQQQQGRTLAYSDCTPLRTVSNQDLSINGLVEEKPLR